MNGADGVGGNGGEVGQRNWRHFDEAKRMRAEHARHGGAEESENEAGEKAVGHDARVDLSGVELHQAEEMERPEQDSDNSG